MTTQPIQLTRRAALKLLTGGAASVALPSMAALAGNFGAGHSGTGHSAVYSTALPRLAAELKVEVFTGKSAPEDTVLLSSIGDHAMVLRQFRPGLLAIRDRILDLNRVLDSTGLKNELTPELIIDAGAVHSVMLPVTKRQPDLAMREYLSVHTATQNLGDGTEIITLNALVDVDGLAVVYVPQAGNDVEFS